MGIVAVVGLIGIVGSGEPLLGVFVLLLTAAIFAVITLWLPRLTFHPQQLELHTRRRTIAYASVGAVKFEGPSKAGIWAALVDRQGRTLTRMSIDESLMAPSTAEQWEALRHLVSLSAINSPYGGSVPPVAGDTLTAQQALPILNGQVQWCRAGNRPGHRDAPIRQFLDKTISLRDPRRGRYAAR